MNLLSKSNRFAATAFALSLTPNAAPAVDWAFQPRIETGIQLYEFEQGAVTRTTSEKAFTRIPTLQLTEFGLELLPEEVPNEGRTVTQTITVSSKKYDNALWTLGGGFTVFADRFFLDASAQGAFDGSGDDNLTETFNLPSTFYQTGEQEVNRAKSNANLEREEYALSLGFAVSEHFSIYGGWKWSKTRFEEKRNGSFSIEQEWRDPEGALPILGGTTRFRYDGTFQDKLEYDFDQSGPFLGAAYGWRFDGNGFLKGALLANVAVAFLDGEFKDVKRTSVSATVDTITVDGDSSATEPTQTDVGAARFDEIAPIPFFEGNTVGVTAGVTWKGDTNVEGLSYLLSINGYSYNFDADTRTGESGGDVTETVVNFRAGIAYVF